MFLSNRGTVYLFANNEVLSGLRSEYRNLLTSVLGSEGVARMCSLKKCC